MSEEPEPNNLLLSIDLAAEDQRDLSLACDAAINTTATLPWLRCDGEDEPDSDDQQDNDHQLDAQGTIADRRDVAAAVAGDRAGCGCGGTPHQAEHGTDDTGPCTCPENSLDGLAASAGTRTGSGQAAPATVLSRRVAELREIARHFATFSYELGPGATEAAAIAQHTLARGSRLKRNQSKKRCAYISRTAAKKYQELLEEEVRTSSSACKLLAAYVQAQRTRNAAMRETIDSVNDMLALVACSSEDALGAPVTWTATPYYDDAQGSERARLSVPKKQQPPFQESTQMTVEDLMQGAEDMNALRYVLGGSKMQQLNANSQFPVPNSLTRFYPSPT